MKIIISSLIFLHLISMHIAAVVYLPRLRVYPSALRPKVFHGQRPCFTRKENTVIVTLSSPRRLGQNPPGAFDRIFLLLGIAPFPLSAYQAATVPFSQIQWHFPSVNVSTDVMRWFSFLGWYP